MKQAIRDFIHIAKIFLTLWTPTAVSILSMYLGALGMGHQLNPLLTNLMIALPSLICVGYALIKYRDERTLWEYEAVFKENAAEELVQIFERQQKKKK